MKERFKTFTVLISKINKYIRKIKTDEMNTFNLKSNHVSCLYYLYKSQSLTAKELCDICGEDKASISRSLDFLEKSGYIFCDSNLKKRYRSALTLTSKGIEIGKEIAKKIDNVLNLVSFGLSEEKREILYESLEIVKNNLENICDNYKGEI